MFQTVDLNTDTNYTNKNQTVHTDGYTRAAARARIVYTHLSTNGDEIPVFYTLRQIS
jgi:hypothetical protein